MSTADPEALIAAGHIDEGVAALEMAGRRGDGGAWLRLAVLRLTGDVVPRDLVGARTALTAAREAGHPDAALMEVALTANGTGGPRDWRLAVALLERAARSDRLAADHLEMLRAMNLDGEGLPRRLPDLERLSERPRVALARGLLSPQEARHVVQAASDLLAPSTVVDPRSGRQIAHPIRTSASAAIGPTRETLPIQAILKRIALLSGTGVDQGEPLTLLAYQPGQQYRPHHDALPGLANQRIATVLLYLNQGYKGGETRFSRSGLTVAGRGGDALVFGNTLPDGRPDPDAEHAGLPVIAGQKLLATRWIRAEPLDPWTMGGSRG
ncbi:2OG-Fe(II) oxygenase [Sphingomonas sp. Y38-1Y]|uniref:2OG-Fe(II) oxygenase n=1 Tax=Sphingomonas sp. Y38-1Y TaxID=3078265 RepID=UPI0028ED498B|nr:2OG-Fe(II) oxygenase [Sphingomonas sp. Y38-1Y]